MTEIENLHARKVGVIGMGQVGSSFAYALIQRGIATELVLVDANTEKAVGEMKELIRKGGESL